MDRTQLRELLAKLRTQETQAMLNLAHVQGQIIMAETVMAQEDKDANNRAAASIHSGDSG